MYTLQVYLKVEKT